MKIFVIDNAGDISANMFTNTASVVFFSDEVLALNAVEEQQVQLILLNYAMQNELTVDYIRSLVTAAPAASLVVVGHGNSEQDVFRCLLAGAKGYQEIQTLAVYMDRLISAIDRSEAWVSRRMVTKLLDAIRLQQESLNFEAVDS